MAFQDNFSKQAELYAKSRPHYPVALYQYLSTLTPAHKMVWDCATGNGQAAVMLAEYYDSVIGTDASTNQIAYAMHHPKVNYRVALAEESGLADHSIDMVTVATALHWFDLDKFYVEVKRVLKPGGVLAAWSYFKLEMEEKVLKVIKKLDKDILKPYWSPDLKKVAHDYKDIPFPFEEIKGPHFDAVTHWNYQNMLAYLQTVSFIQKYIEINGKDPVDQVRDEMKEAWGDLDRTKEIKWPLVLKIGRVW